jgi:hypothetical protein
MQTPSFRYDCLKPIERAKRWEEAFDYKISQLAGFECELVLYAMDVSFITNALLVATNGSSRRQNRLMTQLGDDCVPICHTNCKLANRALVSHLTG